MVQEQRPRDMSLPDRIAMLERSLQRERNKRKMNDSELAEKLEVVMTMMDGWRRGRSLFKKEPIRIILDTEDEESAREILSELADSDALELGR